MEIILVKITFEHIIFTFNFEIKLILLEFIEIPNIHFSVIKFSKNI